MNLPLLNPNHYLNAYPEYIEDQLDIDNVASCTFLKFNPRGTLIAFGCVDGKVIIYDFTTRSKSRVLPHGKNLLVELKTQGKKFSNANERILKLLPAHQHKPRALRIVNTFDESVAAEDDASSSNNDHLANNNHHGGDKSAAAVSSDSNSDSGAAATQSASQGHGLAITTVSWFRNSKKIVSGSYDYKVLLWDLVTRRIEQAYEFCSSVYKVEMNPKNKYVQIYHHQILKKRNTTRHANVYRKTC